MKNFLDRLLPWCAVGVVVHVRLHHLPPAQHDRIVGLADRRRPIAFEIGEERQPVAIDAVVAHALAPHQLEHLRPDLVMLLLVDRLVARLQPHHSRHPHPKPPLPERLSRPPPSLRDRHHLASPPPSPPPALPPTPA